MKTLFTVPLIVLIICTNASAQCTDCSASGNLNISTGIDPITGELLEIGAVDPAWQLVNFPPLDNYSSANINIPNTNVIQGYNNWLNLNDCNPGPCGILSPDVNSYLPGNTYPSQPWRFRRYFCVCQRSKITLNGSARMDDGGRINVYDMNGDPITNSSGLPIEVGSWSTNSSLNASFPLEPGTYYVEAEVENLGGNYFGFVINAVLLNDENTLSNVSEFCCNDTDLGFITLQKILENVECNGRIDEYEQPGEGWVFNLLNSDGEIIQTQTTDANGELTFSVLSDGLYTVEEQFQEGWTPSSPSNGSQQVEVVNGTAEILTFFNCEEDLETVPSSCCPELDNLISNAGFNQGNAGFTTQYAFDGSTPTLNSLMPGECGIFSIDQLATVCPNWGNLSDCQTAGNMLVVNGATGQSSGKKLVWQQTISNIEAWKEYRFCANFKHLTQCCFDVQPKVDIKFSLEGNDVLDVSIDNPADVNCGWQQISKNFYTQEYSGNINVQIWLDETNLGDGNDLAIDNISLTEIPKMDESYTAFTLNPAQTGDGQYQLTVIATNPLPEGEGCGGAWSIIAVDKNGVEHEVYNASNWWIDNYSNSTNFPGYNGFITYNDADQVVEAPSVSNNSTPGIFSDQVTYLIKRGVYCDCMGWNEHTDPYRFKRKRPDRKKRKAGRNK